MAGSCPLPKTESQNCALWNHAESQSQWQKQELLVKDFQGPSIQLITQTFNINILDFIPCYRFCFEKFPASIYLLKFNNRNTGTWCSKLTVKTTYNFEYILHHVLVFLLLTLNMCFQKITELLDIVKIVQNYFSVEFYIEKI